MNGIDELTHDATVLRVGLLVGLVDGDEIHAWATACVARMASPPVALVDLLLVPTTDLSALRHALWPLTEDPPTVAAVEALLGRLHADLGNGRRTIADTIRILEQLRRFERLPPPLHEVIERHVHAHALAHEHEGAARDAVETEVRAWLASYPRVGG
jgi:hypothetical protein